MIAEPWMDTLKAAVEAGHYRTEAAEDEQTPLTAFPGVAVAARYMFAVDAAEGYLYGPDGESRRLIKGLGYRFLDLEGWGIGLAWGCLPDREEARAAVRYYEQHPTIFLHPAVWEEEDRVVRSRISRMIGCCVLGTDDTEDGTAWAVDRYTRIHRGRRERGIA